MIYKNTNNIWSTQDVNLVGSYIAATSSRIIILQSSADIDFGNNSYQSDRGVYSDNNGATWTSFTTDNRVVALTSSNNRFVACPDRFMSQAFGRSSDGGSLLWSSSSGTSWSKITSTNRSSTFKSYLGELYYNVAYGNNTFIAVGQAILLQDSVYNPIAAISSDGLSWSVVNMPNNEAYAAICYGNGKWVALCNGSRSYSPAPGQGSIMIGRHYDYTFSGALYYGHKYSDSNIMRGSRRVAISNDNGATWTSYDDAMPVIDQWNTISYNGSHFIAFGTTIDVYATSTDGITWTLRNLPASNILGLFDGVAYDGSSYYVGGIGRLKIKGP